MAGSVDGSEFWLPSEFLTDDDFLIDRENFKKSNSQSASQFCFPYSFETERDQRMEKKRWVMSTSPQSTLTHLGSWGSRSAGGSSNGSPNGMPSPPTTPSGAKNEAIGELIYCAADQVAKLKLHGGDGLGLGPARYQALSGTPKSLPQFYSEARIPNTSCFSNTHFQQKQQNDGCGLWYNQQNMYQNRGRTLNDAAQAAWVLKQSPTGERAVSLGGSGGPGGGAPAKRACAGTGVFLPRRYENNNDSNGFSSDSRKKPGSITVLTGTAAVHAPTKNLNDMNALAQSQQQSQIRSSRGFVPDYTLYSFVGRRHTMLLQQHRSFLSSLEEGSAFVSCDTYLLPQEWTY